MTDILKICFGAVVAAAAIILVKQYKPEYAFAVEVCAIAATVLAGIAYVADMSRAVYLMTDVGGLDREYIKLLLKALGAAVVTQVASDICKDNGSTALAGNVETVGKLIILSFTLPMLKSVAELAAGLINI